VQILHSLSDPPVAVTAAVLLGECDCSITDSLSVRTPVAIWRQSVYDACTARGFKLVSGSASDTRVPLVSLVLPKAALTAADAAETGDHIYADNVFGLLIAQLTLHAKPKRRAVLHG
jgi:hypothetical protein